MSDDERQKAAHRIGVCIGKIRCTLALLETTKKQLLARHTRFIPGFHAKPPDSEKSALSTNKSKQADQPLPGEQEDGGKKTK